MNKGGRGAFLIALTIQLSACAVGNQYDYAAAQMALPVRGAGPLAVAVLDERPYVMSGGKSSDFVGLQRGGFGNPFDVHTQSGNPLAFEMQAVLMRALRESGFEPRPLDVQGRGENAVTAAVTAEGQVRNVVLLVKEWKTDAMMHFALSYDLVLRVLDEGAAVLGESSGSGSKEEIGGAGFEGQNSQSAAQAFETKVARLFNDPGIKRALAP